MQATPGREPMVRLPPRCPPTPHLQKVKFAKKFPDADPLAIDLMERMLEFDPRKRIDVNEALKHPWLAQLHDESAEPVAPGAAVRPPNQKTIRRPMPWVEGGGEEAWGGRGKWAPQVGCRARQQSRGGCWAAAPVSTGEMKGQQRGNALGCAEPAAPSPFPHLAPHPPDSTRLPLPLPAAPFEFDFEDAQLDEQAVRDLVWEEMR